jgi:hypothetical protein
MDHEALLRRAFAAYYRSGANMQPANTSGVRKYKGLWYVVLENANGVLAVYRVKNDGFLRAMRRWPEELGQK